MTSSRSRAALGPRCGSLAVVAVLAVGPAGCVKSPPVLHPGSVAAPRIPLPPPLTDNSALGYLRAHQVVRLAERVGAGAMVNMAAGRGVDLGALDPEQPIVVVVGDPRDGIDKTPVMAALPIAPRGPMAQMLGAVLGPEHTRPLGRGLSLALNQPPVDEAHGGPLLERLSASPLATDVELYFNAAGIMAGYGDRLRRGFQTMQEQMARQNQAQGKLAAGMVSAYFDFMVGMLDKLQSMSMGIDATPDSIDVTTVSQDKGAGQAALPDRAMAVPNLAQFVPPSSVRFETGGARFDRMYDLALKFYESAFTDDPQTWQQVKDVLNVMKKGQSLTAGGFDFGDRLFSGTAVVQADNAEEKFEAARRMVGLLSAPGFQKFFAAGGISVTVTLDREARKSSGWAVDHVVYKMVPTADNKAIAAMKKLLDRPFSAEIARVGSYLVWQFNGTPESFDKVVADLISGKGPNPPLSARTTQPAGGSIYGDVDVSRVLAAVDRLLSADKPTALPHLEAGLPNLTFFGYDAGHVSYYRLSMPMPLYNVLRDAAAGAGRRNADGNDGAYLPQPKD